ncbi:MAG: hypothetical protein P1U80_00795 [Pseudomonadales bacterium]|nr:hypothetical protein [Pseudomonadales bacterium]
MKFKLCGLFGILLSSQVAATDYTGKIQGLVLYQISTTSPPILFITATSGVTGTDCNTTNRYTIHLDNDYGKAIYSLLLTAYATGEPVRLKGLGTCNNFGNAEDLRYMCTENGPC